MIVFSSLDLYSLERIYGPGSYRTNNGNKFWVSAYKNSSGYYNLSIWTKYWSRRVEGDVDLYVYIHNDIIPRFKSNLRTASMKCQEWGNVAKENSLSYYSKDLPIEISYSEISCFDLSHPNDTEIDCTFNYYDSDGPSVTFHFIARQVNNGGIQHAYGTYIVLQPDEILELIDEFDVIISDQRNRDIRETQLDKLFK